MKSQLLFDVYVYNILVIIAYFLHKVLVGVTKQKNNFISVIRSKLNGLKGRKCWIIRIFHRIKAFIIHYYTFMYNVCIILYYRQWGEQSDTSSVGRHHYKRSGDCTCGGVNVNQDQDNYYIIDYCIAT